MMTDEEVEQVLHKAHGSMEDIPGDLRVLVEQALAEGRRELENTGTLRVTFWMRQSGGRVDRCRLEERMNELMNYGPAKEAILKLVRETARDAGATAVVTVTDTWMGLPTPKQVRMSRENREELERLMEGRSLDEVEAQGLVRRTEALTVTVQTPDEYAIVNQFYERNQKACTIRWGERQIMSGKQSEFNGRGKMFGVPDGGE